jgi:DNA repair protein SbcC/Rad50
MLKGGIWLKIFHTADLHLGMTYGSRGYPDYLRKRLIEARFEALERLVDVANSESCQLFIVAGDLFHRINMPRETVLRVIKILSDFTGNCVAVLPGNHDFYDEFNSVWKNFSDNAFDDLVLLNEARPYDLSDYGLDVVLYPAPCLSRSSAENALGWLKGLERGKTGWHFGVAHGTVRGISLDLDDRYFPMNQEELRAIGLDHWFLGHTHVRYPAMEMARDCGFTFSGTPEPDGFDCTHQGYAWVVSFSKEGAEARSVTTGVYRFLDRQREIKKLEDLAELKQELEGESEFRLARLVLKGTLPRDEYDTRRASQEWKGYLKKFIPYPVGDTIAVELAFICEKGEEYTLERCWGSGKASHLTLPGGVVIREDISIQNKLDELLGYGRATFEGVLFARQEEMLKTVEMLKSNREAVSTLSEILRAVVFEAGGVSLDELIQVIESEKKLLLDSWDVDRDGPKGGRGINNPWLKNVGAVLKAFYEVEEGKSSLLQARLVEKNLDELRKQLREVTGEAREVLGPKLSEMEKLEGDIRKRLSLEPKLESIQVQERSLGQINQRWPQLEAEIRVMEQLAEKERIRLDSLEQENIEAVQILKAREKRAVLEVVKPLRNRQLAREEELKNLPAITHIKELAAYQVQIEKNKAVLDAMRLRAEMTADKPLDIKVSLGLEDAREITVTGQESFNAAGRMVMECSDWKLEVKSGEQDVDQIIVDIKDTNEKYLQKQKQLSVENLEDARELLGKRTTIVEEIRELSIKSEANLKGQGFDELEKEIDALPPDKQVREPAMIAEEAGKLRASIEATFGKTGAQRELIGQWEKEYGTSQKVLERLVELKTEANSILKQLQPLARLPEEYSSPEEYMDALAELKSRSKELFETESELKIGLTKAENDLPLQSTEELQEKLQSAERKFANLKKRAQALLVVEKAFNDLANSMDKNTFDPLAASFARYLSPVTGHRYDEVRLDGSLPTAIVSKNQELPVDLLSTGTTRGIALAIRLAMGEHLLKNRSGFMIMDDPLVDLDPERKKLAAEIICKYAESTQLIITTCDPVTASLLGGCTVELEAVI